MRIGDPSGFRSEFRNHFGPFRTHDAKITSKCACLCIEPTTHCDLLPVPVYLTFPFALPLEVHDADDRVLGEEDDRYEKLASRVKDLQAANAHTKVILSLLQRSQGVVARCMVKEEVSAWSLGA